MIIANQSFGHMMIDIVNSLTYVYDIQNIAEGRNF